jgi:pimeloyl-ACP methyl ester carboxylesterase
VRKVVPLLEGIETLTPTLPLGSHTEPVPPGTDLSPPGLARLVVEQLEGDVLLVGNDTGCAIAQLVAAHHPERISGLVLTNCDAYERFFPPLFRPLQYAARVPGGVEAIAASLRVPAARRLPIAHGKLTKRPIERAVTDAWAAPSREDRLVFPPSIAERLAADFPRARIEWIDDSLTFVPEDRPDALAAILRAAAGVSSQ